MAETLEEKFKKAVWIIRNGEPIPTDNKTKLEFYSYFKQATEGDVKGDRPNMIRLEARAKWDAWAKLKGMGRDQAMQGYIDLLGDPEVWENHELLKTKYLEEKAAGKV